MLGKRIEKLEHIFLSNTAKLDALVAARIVFQRLVARYSYSEAVEGCEKYYSEIPIELIAMKATGKLKTAENKVLAQMERGAATMTDKEKIQELARRLISKRGFKVDDVLTAFVERFPHLEKDEIENLVLAVRTSLNL
jgi:hypothetical protein